jgi:hypothetical protein
MKKRINAFTYIEILIGITIVLFVLVGMNGIFGTGIRSSKKAENSYVALCYAQELMEKTITKDFGSIVSVAQENTADGFVKSLQVVYPYKNSQDRKMVVVTVSFPDMRDMKLNCIVTNSVIGGSSIL